MKKETLEKILREDIEDVMFKTKQKDIGTSMRKGTTIKIEDDCVIIMMKDIRRIYIDTSSIIAVDARIRKNSEWKQK
ncbi:hypothetical protein [Clostridium oceanicum]|uniref:Uncharacterized protein n=1 Tax=Clostridium oceanicum TaxID=1543 RepID=A0ABP3URL1_9CLOT